MKARYVFALLMLTLVSAAPRLAHADIVINEFMYDDGGAGDDREFVELYNSGGVAVDISGWTLHSRDQVGTNFTDTIPASTSIAPGGYYVIGNTGVLNVNQVVAANHWENAGETLELRNGTVAAGTLMDALVYEANFGPTAASNNGYGTLPAGMTLATDQYWGGHNTADVAAAPSSGTPTSVARYTDGRDTSDVGRDYGLRPATPGTNNNPTSAITVYEPPGVDGQADGSTVAGLTGSFVNARVFTPGTVTAGLNLNAIPAPPNSSKAIIAWDNTGGGNAVVANSLFAGTAQSFLINAYLDTANLPLSTNASAVTFRGSEFTFYGLAGSIDALTGLASVSGGVGLAATNSANGATGIAWYYEKVGETVTGNGIVSEKLYLIDAGNGGNENTEASNTTADEWVILATFDLSTTASAWHQLGISIDAAGNGVAKYDNNSVAFTTLAGLYGSFYVGYRENTQDGTVTGTPSYLRPATFAIVPEPSAFLFGSVICGVIGFVACSRRFVASKRLDAASDE